MDCVSAFIVDQDQDQAIEPASYGAICPSLKITCGWEAEGLMLVLLRVASLRRGRQLHVDSSLKDCMCMSAISEPNTPQLAKASHRSARIIER